MSSSHRTFSLRLQAWLALLLPVVFILGAQAGLQYNARHADALQRQIQVLDEWQDQTLALHTHVVIAEGALRGYRLAGGRDDVLLRQYVAARRAATATLEAMRRQEPPAGAQSEHLRHLETLVPRRLALLEQFRLADPAIAPGTEPAAQTVARGRELSEQIAREIAYFRQSQERLTALREARLAQVERLTDAFWIAIPIAVLIGVAAAGVQTSRLIRRIELVRRNTTRLVHGEPLEPMPAGGGELMALHHSLEEAARLLEDGKRESEDARREAERANQAKTAFLSRMSHELRTPLTAVLGFAELLEMDELDDSQRDSVRHIRNAGRHLLTLINEVLDIARIESGHLAVSNEPLELGPVVAEALTLIRPLAEERGIQASTSSPSGLFVKADRQRLTQVLLNLLSNAVKYNREHGEVRLTCVVDGGRVRLSVADTGLGIAPALLPRVFNAFDRLGAEQTDIEGTGVGLTLSKGLVEVMGGALTVDSETGVGTVFTIDLARAPAEAAAVRTGDAPLVAGDEPLPPVTVLYVEDNAANIDLVAGLLQRHESVRLLTTMQGRLAVDLARTHRPDLVLLDLHLPDLDGEEVLRRLRQDPETADLLVVMLTADATPGQERRLRALGADDYLTKPLDFGRVRGLLRRAAMGVAP